MFIYIYIYIQCALDIGPVSRNRFVLWCKLVSELYRVAATQFDLNFLLRFPSNDLPILRRSEEIDSSRDTLVHGDAGGGGRVARFHQFRTR